MHNYILSWMFDGYQWITYGYSEATASAADPLNFDAAGWLMS